MLIQRSGRLVKVGMFFHQYVSNYHTCNIETLTERRMLRSEHHMKWFALLYCTVKLHMKYRILLKNVRVMTDVI